MTVAYVDTSCLVAIAFGEPGAKAIARQMDAAQELVSSNLLEAELRSVFSRECAELPAELLDGISWIVPDRPLHEEIQAVLTAGYVRGADCWHLATALYLAANPGELAFLTLDERQRGVAQDLGLARQ